MVSRRQTRLVAIIDPLVFFAVLGHCCPMSINLECQNYRDGRENKENKKYHQTYCFFDLNLLEEIMIGEGTVVWRGIT